MQLDLLACRVEATKDAGALHMDVLAPRATSDSDEILAVLRTGSVYSALLLLRAKHATRAECAGNLLLTWRRTRQGLEMVQPFNSC